MTLHSNHWKISSCAILCLGFSALSFAVTQRKAGQPTLEQLTKASDEVIIGKVKHKSAGFVGRNIETNYDIEVSDLLKGKNYQPGRQVQMTVIGGSITSPPLTQFVEAQPYMYSGQEVALFLTTQAVKRTSQQLNQVNPQSKLLTTPRVVGMNRGVFTVFTDKDGSRKLARINLEERGIIPQDDVLSKTVSAVKSGAMKRIDLPVVPLTADSANSRDPLEQTGRQLDPHSGKLPAHLALGRIDASGPIPVQDLDEFKSDVRKFSQE